ncbi:MAG: zinc-dependent metalloprotease [bacterium]|nr:zinc-dependent metalloprotease [bacterium]MDE0602577.1 zinc-dependent metalloprotease [bacterium]
MSEDLFTRLMRMFNQPGPVNLDLAREISRHLAGEAQLLNPWTSEELIELVRLAEYQVSEVAPFSFPPASTVIPLGPREWGDAMVEEFAPVVEPFAAQVGEGAAGQPWGMLIPLGPVIAGAQLGAMAGLMAGRVIGACETGLPTGLSNRTLLVATVIEDLADQLPVDGRQVRMWAALYETAHRAVFSLPHVADLFRTFNEDYASRLKLAPDSLMEQLGSIGNDPSAIFQLDLEDEGTDLFDSSAAGPARENLSAFLGMTGGMARWLVAEAGARLLPDLDTIASEREGTLDLSDPAAQTGAMVTASPEAIAAGEVFLAEVEERFGPAAAQRIWQPDGFPTPEEIYDPVGWAARVLLNDPLW